VSGSGSASAGPSQTDNYANIPPLSFYRPDALPAAQPTASKHIKPETEKRMNRINTKNYNL